MIEPQGIIKVRCSKRVSYYWLIMIEIKQTEFQN